MKSEKVISTGYFYAKDVPIIVDSKIKSDGFSELNKDGAHVCQGITSPRMTVVMYSMGDQRKDQKRVNALDSIFMELLANNQILGYNLSGVSK